MVNLLIDYLFIDILSAPLADSLKISNENKTTKKTMPLDEKTPPHPLETSKRPTFRESLLSDVHTRIVSASLIDAHSDALESFQGAMRDTQNEVEKACQQRKSQRLNRLTRIKSTISGSQNIDMVPAPVPLTQTGVDVDDLFSALKEEIGEERSLIRRQHEKESFDAVWG